MVEKEDSKFIPIWITKGLNGPKDWQQVFDEINRLIDEKLSKESTHDR